MNRIKELRENCNMTAFQLSHYLNISEEEVEMIEVGGMSLTTVQLDRLCDLFRCSEDHVLGFDKGYVEPIDYKDRSDEVIKTIASVMRIVKNIASLSKY